MSGDGGLDGSLKKLGEAGGQAGAVAAIIGLLIGLLPIRRFSFSGVIEPASGPAASATLAMQSGQRQGGAVTLVGRALEHEPVAGDYLALAAPAAVWAQYEMARFLVSEPRSPEAAESYALVREGLDHHLAGDAAEAIAAFQHAIELDRDNWAAKVNLAVTQARLAKDCGAAEAVLAQAVEDFESEWG